MKGGKAIEVWDWRKIKELVEAEELKGNKLKAFILAGLFGTGARAGEFVSLEKKDFFLDLEKNVLKVTVPTFKNPKQHKRLVLIHCGLEAWIVRPIREWLEFLGEKYNGLVLPRSRRWLEYKCRDWWGVHPHFFRHCRATYCYTFLGMRDVEVQAFMGWSDTQMASRYTHLRDTDLLNVFDRILGEGL